jgi:hypothetical protein
MPDVKTKIQTAADKKYNGSYRFFKEKNLCNLIGKEGIDEIKSKLDQTLHDPVCLMIHCYMNDIHNHPTCKCGNLQKFNATTKEFSKYCSNKCRFDSMSDVVELRKQTNLKKYGSTNFLASETGREKITQTNLKKYGVDNFTKTDVYKQSRSGVPLSEKTKEKTRQRHRQRYYESLREKYPFAEPLFSLDEYEGVKGYKQYPWLCNTCNKQFISSCDNGASPVCTHCKPKGSAHEIVIKQYLDSLGVEYVFRYRGLPSGREIDIYIPSKKFGIELCGLFYHSTAGYNYSKTDHISKLNECESCGISLFTIFDDEMFDPVKRKIVLSKIKHRVIGSKYKIHARKCNVIVPSASDAVRFMEKYHIQGSIGSTYKFGLSYKRRLVALMTFNKGRIATGNTAIDSTWELGRYCTISNFTVVGGAGKLLEHFKRLIGSGKIISYADRRWSNGGVYSKLGFTFVKDTIPNYWYTKTFKSREHRMHYQKHKLCSMQSYDHSLTEEEIMKREKYFRIWDCGSKLYEMIF